MVSGLHDYTAKRQNLQHGNHQQQQAVGKQLNSHCVFGVNREETLSRAAGIEGIAVITEGFTMQH